MLKPSFRNPAVLAKMLATLDQLTGGRVIGSLGAGWLKPEYETDDFSFIDDHDDRIAHEREVVLLLKELWTRPAPERVTFEGKHVRIRELAFNPAPFQKPHPPIWIGGDSEATVALATELGDGWVPLLRGQPEIVQEFRASPDWPSRPMTVVRITWMLVAESREAALPDAERAYETVLGTATLKAPASFDEFLEREVIGMPAECRAKIEVLEQAGIDHHLVTSRTTSSRSASRDFSCLASEICDFSMVPRRVVCRSGVDVRRGGRRCCRRLASADLSGPPGAARNA